MTDKVEVAIKLLVPEAKVPYAAYAGDACFDVSCVDHVTIAAGTVQKVRLGFSLHLPEGWEAQVRPRSGLSSKGIVCMFGTCDSGYRGEVCAMLLNTTDQNWFAEAGTRVAQIAIRPVPIVTFNMVETVPVSDRGENGFGSSGLT